MWAGVRYGVHVPWQLSSSSLGHWPVRDLAVYEEQRHPQKATQCSMPFFVQGNQGVTCRQPVPETPYIQVLSASDVPPKFSGKVRHVR